MLIFSLSISSSVDGSHGASKYVVITAFPTVDQAVAYLRGNNECACSQLLGVLGGVADAYNEEGYALEDDTSDSGRVQVSIEPYKSTNRNGNLRSFPITSQPFRTKGNCCFVIDKKSNGLPQSLSSQCDSFVHIPHMNGANSAGQLLDTPACLSIALYHFTIWAGYQERNVVGYKFELERETKICSTVTTEQRIKTRQQQEIDAGESIEDANLLYEHREDGDY